MLKFVCDVVMSCKIWSFHGSEDSSHGLLSSGLCSSPQRWRQQGPPKHWCPFTSLCGITNRKTST